jgi:hypothetical protein
MLGKLKYLINNVDYGTVFIEYKKSSIKGSNFALKPLTVRNQNN